MPFEMCLLVYLKSYLMAAIRPVVLIEIVLRDVGKFCKLLLCQPVLPPCLMCVSMYLWLCVHSCQVTAVLTEVIATQASSQRCLLLSLGSKCAMDANV